MLALTECHRSKLGICAAALGEPIVDWTSLQIPRQKTGNEEIKDLGKDTGDEAESLRSLRSALFPSIGYCLDPFASPLLFFRTPGLDIATPNPAILDRTTDQEDVPVETLTVEPKRRSHRKYPPAESDLRLPWTRIDVGTVEALKAQGLEMAQLLHRSINTWERKRCEPERTMDAGSRIHVKERDSFWKEPDVFENLHSTGTSPPQPLNPPSHVRRYPINTPNRRPILSVLRESEMVRRNIVIAIIIICLFVVLSIVGYAIYAAQNRVSFFGSRRIVEVDED
ncbi:MAG: hypothetical protein LQ342_006103 [Letrouitia transgressa]|nr:MAG: hypothetical protein LQ342_006103 [Letrouitia transgressa]